VSNNIIFLYTRVSVCLRETPRSVKVPRPLSNSKIHYRFHNSALLQGCW